MLKNFVLLCILGGLVIACSTPTRDCAAFKEGRFRYTALIDGVEQTTVFERDQEIEIDYFEGRADTSSVRWINDCEFIVKNLNPKNLSEQKSIHMKILSTTDSSYTFEYGLVGSAQKTRGTAIKMN
ncbi:DNA topoisomerase IV [Muriicola marianensis]|uniref:DNA topoisomerase IV n=1 Tax=Muriicola marianensis TaxID=1324801 RepID=A0ABQ1QNQ8_9FLAO|nr:DNA topoisomerase IV [Muriicola marianensis]GGD38335.1 hypothetical protein GCM10011361_01820 [Muriicola marianensis]